MKHIILALALWCSPLALALAADHSPIPEQSPATVVETFLARSPGKNTCCKRCSKGKPCGDSCIAVSKTCRSGPGCAC